jgi:hypothetical protein
MPKRNKRNDNDVSYSPLPPTELPNVPAPPPPQVGRVVIVQDDKKANRELRRIADALERIANA